jgi:hypothetical protein
MEQQTPNIKKLAYIYSCLEKANKEGLYNLNESYEILNSILELRKFISENEKIENIPSTQKVIVENLQETQNNKEQINNSDFRQDFKANNFSYVDLNNITL